HDALKARVHQVLCGRPVVLALGGGTFAQANNQELLHEAGLSVWLDAGLGLIQQRIEGQNHRPLAQDPERFAELYAERQLAYAKADFRVPVDTNDSAATLKRVMELPLWD
ncbi:MAG TPA: shikimate kinase, partial [Bryobacteraceae bacterium]|nr:shikimate kinase [Bryobacteraceae bacterium]